MILSARDYIIQAFHLLSQQMDISKITIHMLIEKAGVNRSSFYYYFQNKENLVENITDNVLEEFFSILQVEINEDTVERGKEYHSMNLALPEIKAACNHIKNYEYLYKQWLTEGKFILKFANALFNYLYGFSRDQTYSTYIAYGTIGYFQIWLNQQSQKSIEEISWDITNMAAKSFFDLSIPIHR